MILAHGAGTDIWRFHAHPDVWLLIVLLGGGYLLALKSWGPKKVPAGAPVATRRQKVLYFTGLGAMWFAADWPMYDLSEGYLFSVHMTQHMIFTFVAPPLMLAGTPRWLYRTLLAPPALLRVVRALTRPVVCLLLFNGIIAFTHWPALVDLSLRVGLVHFLIHSALVVSAALMWFPVIEPLPELARLSPPGKMLHLFLQSILPTVPASFLTFADAPLYKFYEDVPRLIPGLSVLYDQQIAGLIMKLGGGALLWGTITVMFFRWSARERSGVIEPVSWEDFERELDVLRLRKG